MKTLPKTFKRWGYTFNQLKREGNVAIYEQKKGKKVFAYEVGIISIRKERSIGKLTLPATEQWPPSEKWGISGWTYITFDRAMDKYVRLTNPELFLI